MTLTSPWRCLRCGDEAAYLGPSLDAKHPLGYCLRGAKGCGRVPISRDLAELEHVLQANGWAAVKRRHLVHLGPRGGLTVKCPLCRDLYAARREGLHAAP